MVLLVHLVHQVELESQENLEFKENGANLVFLDHKVNLANVVSLEILQQLLDLRVKMANLVKMALMVCQVFLASLDKKETQEIKDLRAEMAEMGKMVNVDPREILANLDPLVILAVKVEMV